MNTVIVLAPHARTHVPLHHSTQGAERPWSLARMPGKALAPGIIGRMLCDAAGIVLQPAMLSRADW